MHTLPQLFMRKNVKEWNKTAMDCYNLRCDCNRCFIYKTYFKDKYYSCKMKYYVQMLKDKIGEPNQNVEAISSGIQILVG
jgi:hypothetical protein